MTSKLCRHCNGTGKEIDQKAMGRKMSLLRHTADLTAKYVAQQIGVSAQYLSDLERGRRAWQRPIIVAYQRACDEELIKQEQEAL